MQLRLFSFKPAFERASRVLGSSTPETHRGVKGNCPPCTGSCLQGRACPSGQTKRIPPSIAKPNL